MNESTLLQPDNRVIMISGASRGIGAAIAKQLASDGYSLSLGVRTPSSVNQFLTEMDQDRILVSRFEANEPSTATKWIEETINYFGNIDGLVNNAGILRDRSFRKMTLDDWDIVMNVHMNGTAYVTHAAWQVMYDKNYGRIVCTSSGSGI